MSVSLMDKKYSYEEIESIANFILERITIKPKLGIICGSGLGGFADLLETPQTLEYTEIPGFPVSTVQGHSGKLVFGTIGGVECVCMKGRFHFYEGYPIWKTAAPVQVMSLIGVKCLIVTNAAGSLNPAINVGDFMLIRDHINLVGITGNNPLRGFNDTRFGPRFPASNNIYSEELCALFKEKSSALGHGQYTKEGTYIFCAGPSYESPAELKFFKLMGADAVGMSTVPETVVASWMGMKVLGCSLITNQCIMDIEDQAEPNHAEVLQVANERALHLQNIVKNVIVDMKDKLQNW